MTLNVSVIIIVGLYRDPPDTIIFAHILIPIIRDNTEISFTYYLHRFNKKQNCS